MISGQQIRDDLRGLFRGGLHFDEPTRAVYAFDGSPLSIRPAGVALPLDVADLTTLIEYAQENRVPLVPRGAGTGVSGSCLGAGLVVDLSRHFQDVLEVGPEWVRVQTGATIAAIEDALQASGRQLALQLDRTRTRTIGGLIATDAGGRNSRCAGYTRDHVLALKVSLDTGEVAEIAEPNFPTTLERGPRFIELRARTAALMAEHRDLVQLTRPHTPFSRCGYQLHDVLTPSGLNLTRLFVGAEGTLGFLTEATIRTVPKPVSQGRILLGFDNLDAALQAGLQLLTVSGITECELFDQRWLATAKRSLGGLKAPAGIGAALFVAVEANTASEVFPSLFQTVSISRQLGGTLLADPTVEATDLARIESFREAVSLGLTHLGAGPRPTRGCEDLAVPVEELARFVPLLRQLIRQHELSAPLQIQVHTGQVSAMPMLDLRSEEDRQKLWSFAEAAHTLALSLGGTISSRESTGLLRAPWLPQQFGPLLPVFRQVKEAFDPANILHPGMLFDSDSSRPAWPFPTPTVLTLPTLRAAVEGCNQCGDCRAIEGRMCPVYHAVPEEMSSPRAKVNLWRDLAATGIETPEAEAIARLCVNCKMCREECPSGVDVSRLMLEARAKHFAAHGLPSGGWVAARIEGLSILAGMFAYSTNFFLRSRITRWIIEKTLGISRHRTLPRFTHRTFLRRALQQRLTGRRATLREATGERVVYFVDLFANFHDPSIGIATVKVLQHHGIEVYVPWRQRSSGMAPLSQGDTETAREFAVANLRTLAPLVREGYRVVVSDPTAALALMQEYPLLLDSPDAKLVAENTTELTAYLWAMHEAGKLRTDFEPLPLQIGHHVPCHIKALHTGIAGPKLLALIPGLTVQTIDKSCSGMAGTYGLMAENYEASLKTGEPMGEALRADRIAYGSTECGACRMQMHTLAKKRTLHPIQYLALAYGLLPDIRTKLNHPLHPRSD
ncbi:MAG: anaerobic glycerol-3-phosphate dehydrogenase subunit C [Fimbriiglobus sp.]